MKIIKATETIPVDHPVFLLFGQPGIGKSSLGYSMHDVLALDFDLGAHRAANRGDTLQIPAWAVIDDLMADPKALEMYAALAVDTVGRCLDVLMVDVIAKNPKHGSGAGNLSQQGWGALKTRFRTWIMQLRAMGKDVLLIAHDKEDKDGDTRIVRPDIVGGSLGEVLKSADFVGYLYMSGKDRILDFSPTDRWFGKNPAGWAPLRVPPIGKATAFMADLYDKGRDALGHISEASAKVTAEIDAWRDAIAGYATAAEYNAAREPIKALPPIVMPQVAKILVDVAKHAGIAFDAKTKTFRDPAKKVDAAELAALVSEQ